MFREGALPTGCSGWLGSTGMLVTTKSLGLQTFAYKRWLIYAIAYHDTYRMGVSYQVREQKYRLKVLHRCGIPSHNPRAAHLTIPEPIAGSSYILYLKSSGSSWLKISSHFSLSRVWKSLEVVALSGSASPSCAGGAPSPVAWGGVTPP